MEHVYPDCFPENIEELIILDGAGKYEIKYYRICRSGMIDRAAFRSSFEDADVRNGGTHNRDVYLDSKEGKIEDIGQFSTSGFEKVSAAKRCLKMMKKHYDGPVIAEGKTTPACGLSMRTRESRFRQKKGERSHIDWWIYEDAEPHLHFVLYEEGEN